MRTRGDVIETAESRFEHGLAEECGVQRADLRAIEDLERREAAAEKARSAIGSLSREEGEALEDTVRRLRAGWR